MGPTGATWAINCVDGSSLTASVPYTGTFAAQSTTECTIRLDDPSSTGGITWSGYSFSTSLARGYDHKSNTFDVCSTLCCSTDSNGDEVCNCRNPRADSCQPELQPAYVPGDNLARSTEY